VGQIGSVYKQPEKREDDSCHSWRAPSKWKRGTRGGREEKQQGEQGEIKKGQKNHAMYICKCSACAKNNRVLNYAIACTYDNNQDEYRLMDNDNWNECRLVYNNTRMNVISNLNSV
jgi:hypothetical protein